MAKFKRVLSRHAWRAGIVAIVYVCGSLTMAQQAAKSVPEASAKQPGAPALPSGQSVTSAAEVPSSRPPGTEKRLPPRENDYQVFRIRTDAETIATELLKVTDPNDVRIAVDKRTNSILAQGPKDSLSKLGATLQKLDSDETSLPLRKSAHFRIVWLAEGVATADTAAPATDLSGIVEELGRMGYKNVRQVAQAIVRTQTDGTFFVTCSPTFVGEQTTLKLVGTVGLMSGVINLRIADLLVSKYPSERRLVHLVLSTDVLPSEYTVLGVAPAEKVPTIFVVQVIPIEK